MSNGGGNPINSTGVNAIALYGTDVSCDANGMDPNMSEVSGAPVVIQRCVRRLDMRPGSAIDCPNDGMDLSARIGKDIRVLPDGSSPDILQISQDIISELEKEECVFAADVIRVGYSPSTRTGTFVIQITTALGTFTMTLSVSQVTIQLLAVN